MAMYKGETKIKDIYVGTEPIVKVYAGEEFCGFFTLSAYNLVANSDLLIPQASPNENQPLGFYFQKANNISLSNGICSFTSTDIWGTIGSATYSFTVGHKIYYYGRFKSDNKGYIIGPANIAGSLVYHNASGDFQFISNITTADGIFNSVSVGDGTTGGGKTIEVDYIGAINITDLVSRGILPSGLTDAGYKTILDNYFNS